MEIQEWATNTLYRKDDIAKYNDRAYLCLQEHTSTVGSEPDIEFTLWQIKANPESRAGGHQVGLALELEP